MNYKGSNYKFFFLFLFCLAQLFTYGQSTLDSLITANHFLFRIGKDSLTGPGITVLKEQLKGTQFVLIGENHNTAEIPDFTTKLFSILHRDFGYRYLALEQDPVTMSSITRDKKNKSIDYLTSYFKGLPHSFTFSGDQEIQMINAVYNISDAKNAIWGCDQSFGISNAFAELRKIKTTTEIDSLFHLATRGDSKSDADQRFIVNPESEDVFKRIHYLYSAVKNSYARFISYSLVKSNSIYSQFKKNNKYASRLDREEYMKQRFTEEYKKAASLNQVPKVLLKFGNAHLIYGFNSGSDVISLGTFVSQLAKFNGNKVLSLNTLILRKDGSTWDLSTYPSAKYLLLFTKHCDTTNSHLIDLRAIRPLYYKGALKAEIGEDIRAKFEELIFGFDYLVLIGNGRSADFTLIQ